MAALAQEFALAVSEDDGTETTNEDRHTASQMADEANNALPAIIQAAFPEVRLCPCTDGRPTHDVDHTHDNAA